MPAAIITGTVTGLRRGVQGDVLNCCRSRRKDVAVHIELLVGGASADAEVRSKLTSINVAIGSTIASKVGGGGKGVRHEAEVATSGAINSIDTKLGAHAVICADGNLALCRRSHFKIRCWS